MPARGLRAAAHSDVSRLDPSAVTYRGRFAPSPSGPLHLGSLVCALASFLDARANNGRWLVRMEDIDPPREQPGAAAGILRCLEKHGLIWDEPVLYQSVQSELYLERLKDLAMRSLSYRCDCTRSRLKSLLGRYDGHCRLRKLSADSPCSVRLDVEAALKAIGEAGENSLALTMEDFVVHRKDGLFAYQLAVVCDDIAQHITHVVRGRDLEPMTAAQQLLFRVFNATPPVYLHIPLITDKSGNKLSKQNHALAVDNNVAASNLLLSCRLLGLIDQNTQQDLREGSVSEILSWATTAWRDHQMTPGDRVAPASFLGH